MTKVKVPSEDSRVLSMDYEELVAKTPRIDKAKIQTHMALAERELPIPKDLDDQVRQLRKIAQTRTPVREWVVMLQNYPELISYLLKGAPWYPMLQHEQTDEEFAAECEEGKRRWYAEAADILLYNAYKKHDEIWNTELARTHFNSDQVDGWDTAGLPWNLEDEGHRMKLFLWLGIPKEEYGF